MIVYQKAHYNKPNVTFPMRVKVKSKFWLKKVKTIVKYNNLHLNIFPLEKGYIIEHIIIII